MEACHCDNLIGTHSGQMASKRDRWNSSGSDEESTKKKKGILARKKKKKDQQSISNYLSTEQGKVGHADLHSPLLQGCRSVYDTYEQVARVSEGSYGIVWKARDIATNETVALKQIKFHVDEPGCTQDIRHVSNGFPVTALREISVLLALSHESIVSVREMVIGKGVDKVFMVMDWFERDLSQIQTDRTEAWSQAEMKGILQQLLSGIAYVHDHWYLHRDLKPSNLLVKKDRIALADFGLARRYQEPQRNKLTLLVVTLWYRSPELLFGEEFYGPAVDMWSMGCIMGELILGQGRSILQGQGELDQIDQIFALVGTPDSTNWPSFDKLPNAGLFRWKRRQNEAQHLRQRFPVARPMSTNPKQVFVDSNGYELLQGMLTLDPSQRLTARQALEHVYFKEGVPPKRPYFEV